MLRRLSVRRARALLLGLFLLHGTALAAWLARLPSVRAELGLSTAALGQLLLLGALGSLATVVGAGAVVTRWGSRASLHAATVVLALGYVALGAGPALGSVPLLGVGVLALGAGFALTNVPQNLQAAAVERALGRTVLPQFHAAFSIGSVVGSLLGAAASWGHVPLAVQFFATAAVVVVWRTASVPGAVLEDGPVVLAEGRAAPADGPAAPEVAPAPLASQVGAPRAAGVRVALRGWTEPRTLVIGLVVMSAALSEGSANNWLSIAVVDAWSRTEAMGAVVFGTFVAAMTAVRLGGTRLIDRFGRVAVLRGSGLAALAGLALFGLAPTLPLAIVGVVAWGMGAALAVPIGIAAANDDPLRAAARTSVVTAFGSVASLAAPPLFGLAAEHLGARHTLLAILVPVAVSVLVAGRVRPPGLAPVPEPVREPRGVLADARDLHPAGVAR